MRKVAFIVLNDDFNKNIMNQERGYVFMGIESPTLSIIITSDEFRAALNPSDREPSPIIVADNTLLPPRIYPPPVSRALTASPPAQPAIPVTEQIVPVLRPGRPFPRLR